MNKKIAFEARPITEQIIFSNTLYEFQKCQTKSKNILERIFLKHFAKKRYLKSVLHKLITKEIASKVMCKKEKELQKILLKEKTNFSYEI